MSDEHHPKEKNRVKIIEIHLSLNQKPRVWKRGFSESASVIVYIQSSSSTDFHFMIQDGCLDPRRRKGQRSAGPPFMDTLQNCTPYVCLQCKSQNLLIVRWARWWQGRLRRESSFQVAMKVLVTQLCPVLCKLMDSVAHQAPLFMEFSRQEYWSGLPFPSPGYLLNPGIEPRSSALQVDSLPCEPPGKPSMSGSHGPS